MSKQVEEAIALYRALRDRKSKLNAAHKEKISKLDEGLQKLEVKLLQFMQEAGIESVKTGSGTAYISTKTRASVKDWMEVIDWVKRHDRWDVLTKGVSKDAILKTVEEEGAPPPGVQLHSERTVNVRSA